MFCVSAVGLVVLMAVSKEIRKGKTPGRLALVYSEHVWTRGGFEVLCCSFSFPFSLCCEVWEQPRRPHDGILNGGNTPLLGFTVHVLILDVPSGKPHRS